MLKEDDSLYDSDIEVSIYDIQDRLNGGDTEDDDVFNISEEYDRRKQDRINYFEVLKLRKTLDISAEM